MTRQDRQLLIQDLCARVPYHPKGHVVNSCNGAECDEWLTCETFTMFTNIMNNTRLYLRPMSSMTEEEKKEFLDAVTWETNGKFYIDECEDISFYQEKYDWLNEHHFDYRGLITKGLAISTEEFNPYKD